MKCAESPGHLAGHENSNNFGMVWAVEHGLELDRRLHQGVEETELDVSSVPEVDHGKRSPAHSLEMQPRETEQKHVLEQGVRARLSSTPGQL